MPAARFKGYCCVIETPTAMKGAIQRDVCLSDGETVREWLSEFVNMKEDQRIDVFNALQESVYFLSLLRVLDYEIHFTMMKGGSIVISFSHTYHVLSSAIRLFPCSWVHVWREG